jgi:hypothetical protein
MSLVNGYLSNRVMGELSIILGLKKLDGCEEKGLIGNDKEGKFCKDFDELKEREEFKLMELNGLEGMKGSEISKVKNGVDSLLKKYGLGMITRTKLKDLREEVKGVMWSYFNRNRDCLSEDIGDFREEIIVELMKGGDVEEVFELYGGSGLVKVA